ncbi:MAG: hypothetical protein V7760_00780 [Marinobacter sp.]
MASELKDYPSWVPRRQTLVILVKLPKKMWIMAAFVTENAGIEKVFRDIYSRARVTEQKPQNSEKVSPDNKV